MLLQVFDKERTGIISREVAQHILGNLGGMDEKAQHHSFVMLELQM